MGNCLISIFHFRTFLEKTAQRVMLHILSTKMKKQNYNQFDSKVADCNPASHVGQIFIKIMVTAPGLHLPLYASINFFPAFAALHFAALNLHMLPYVFPSDPQTGANISMQNILGQSE